MNEDEIKQKIIQQRMSEAVQQQASAQLQQKQIEEMLKTIIVKILEKKARERLANLKLVKPQLAMQLEMYLVQAYQSGQLNDKISDDQLVSILMKIDQGKRDIQIKRK